MGMHHLRKLYVSKMANFCYKFHLTTIIDMLICFNEILAYLGHTLDERVFIAFRIKVEIVIFLSCSGLSI